MITSSAGAALLDKAKASPTQELAIAAQALVHIIEAIENEILVNVLADVYGDSDNTMAFLKVANLCDLQYDKSGALLGQVRNLAWYRYRPTASGLSQEQIDVGDFA